MDRKNLMMLLGIGLILGFLGLYYIFIVCNILVLYYNWGFGPGLWILY